MNPDGSGRYVRLDSYKAGQEIVSRKYTQFGEIEVSTGVKYIRELKEKYPPGTKIANVASNKTGLNKDLTVGEGIAGDMILEVPVQKGGIPREVIDEADKYSITIRDVQGTEYN